MWAPSGRGDEDNLDDETLPDPSDMSSNEFVLVQDSYILVVSVSISFHHNLNTHTHTSAINMHD